MIKITSPAKKLYCEKCDDIVDYEIITKKEIRSVRGGNIEIEAKVAKCKKCGNELFDAYLENENLKKLYRVYAQKHNLVLPEDIKRIREKYNVSQALFANILGIGKATIERYENGSLPTESISNLIKAAENPTIFLDLLEKNKDKLSVSDYEYIRKKVKSIIENSTNDMELFERFFELINRSKNLDFQKLYGVTAAILDTLKRMGIYIVSKTKFFKLIWLVESNYYDKLKLRLTGLAFARLPLGPVPNQYSTFLDLLKNANIIDIEEKVPDNDDFDTQTYLLPKDLAAINYLNERELEFVDKIIKKYGEWKTKDLINLTHEDPRWKNKKDGELIELESVD